MNEKGQEKESYRQREKNVNEKTRKHHVPRKRSAEKKYEPCPRWKNLGLMSPCGYVMILCKMCLKISSADRVINRVSVTVILVSFPHVFPLLFRFTF